jgi:tRNA-specific 2-thiouridylase
VSAYTVGQRRGLGLAGDRARFVLRVDAPARRVVVGGAAGLLGDRCTIERTRWIPFERLRGALRARVRIRAAHPGAPAVIEERGEGRAEIRFDAPERAITPGQAAVAYDGDLVIGGGWIAGPQPGAAGSDA